MKTIADEAKTLAMDETFQGLPATQLRQLAFASERFAFADGEPIIRQGDDEGNGYLVLEGKVDATLKTEEGERKLGTVEAGFLVGFDALITGGNYLVTVTANGPATLLRIRRTSFLELLEGDKEAMSRLLRTLSERKARVEEQLSVKLG